VTRTKTIRIAADLADMLQGIAAFDATAGTPAAVLDPLIRRAVEKKFARLPPAVRRLYLPPVTRARSAK
jgi:hypothetical protein